MPSIHIPDKYAYAIIRLGKTPKEFVKTAVKEKLKSLGIDVDDDSSD